MTPFTLPSIRSVKRGREKRDGRPASDLCKEGGREWREGGRETLVLSSGFPPRPCNYEFFSQGKKVQSTHGTRLKENLCPDVEPLTSACVLMQNHSISLQKVQSSLCI